MVGNAATKGSISGHLVSGGGSLAYHERFCNGIAERDHILLRFKAEVIIQQLLAEMDLSIPSASSTVTNGTVVGKVEGVDTAGGYIL